MNEVIFVVGLSGEVVILDIKPDDIVQEYGDLFDGWVFDMPPGVYRSSFRVIHIEYPMDGDYDAQVEFGEDSVLLWEVPKNIERK